MELSLRNPAFVNTGAAAGDTLLNIERIDATQFDDKIGGGDEGNFLRLNGGNDIAYGFGGDDTIRGDDGDDRLYGMDGDDDLRGGDGDDWLDGGWGADRHVGGAGTDTVRFSSENFGDLQVYLYDARLNVGLAVEGDTYNSVENVVMGIGNDIVHGDASNNFIFDRGGDDELRGRQGDDTLDGYAGRDTLYGDEGNDLLLGGAGFDRLYGGTGDDTLDGGKEEDTLTGGDGADTFVFDQINNSKMTVTDFETGTDSIDISDWGFADATAFEAAVDVFDILDSSDQKVGLGIRFAPGEVISIEVADYTLDTGDFII
jgi:Ca2+-binding RTX toxin-like protein